MRPGQNRRMRGRNNSGGGNNNGNRKSPNPLQRSYESNGPDVKVRGTAQHVAEKYLQLARDAQSSGDTVAAESYFQFAEHYYRILLAAQEQMAQQFGHSFPPNRAFVEDADEGEEEGDEDGQSFQPGTGPQPEMRANGYGNSNGYNGHGGGQRPEGGEGGEGQQQGGQRFDRQNRRERFNNDRNNNNNGERRFDRQDRGERRFDRNAEGGQGAPGGYAPRPDAPRSDIPVSEGGAVEAAPEQAQGEQRRFEPRPERSERPQRERRPRREREVEADAGDEVAAALPSFLTNPVRVPVAEPVEAPAAEPAAAPVEPAGDEAEAAPKRTRRRRSPREVMDALGSETDGSAE